MNSSPEDWPVPAVALSSFGAPLSSWWSRVGAYILDTLILLVPSILIDVIIANAATNANTVDTTNNSGSATLVIVLPTILTAVYFGLLNGTGRGQTPGNRVAGIAVRDAQTGALVGFWRALLRWFVRFALYLLFVVPGMISDLWPLWDRQHQTFADKAAGTVMIRLR